MRQSALTHTQNYIRSIKFIYILGDFKIEAYSSISTYSYEASPVILYFSLCPLPSQLFLMSIPNQKPTSPTNIFPYIQKNICVEKMV